MIEHVAEIVAAYVGKNRVSSTELPALIQEVSQSLAGLGQTPGAPEPVAPAVSIRQSVRPEYLVCLDCGRKSKMLKRHLSAAHGLTVNEYRTRWSLPLTYPMVPPNHAARRSEAAKSYGFGTHNRGRRAARR